MHAHESARASVLVLALVVAAALAGCLDGGGETGAPVPGDTVVIPGPWVFEPAALEVGVGENVTWRNDGSALHAVTFEDVDFDEDIPPGESIRFAFDEPGTYAYVCKYHPPDMRGTITVVERATNGTADAPDAAAR